MGSTYDIVVAGGGHNGLIAAAYLAKAGLSVCVVEQQKYVGGGVSTRELTIPGFKHDVCSICHGNIQFNPMLMNDELKLFSKYGLKYHIPDECISVLYPDDQFAIWYRDIDKTCQQIAKFSQKDADTYHKFATWAVGILDFLAEGMYKPPAPYGAVMSMLEQSPEGFEMERYFHLSLLEACTELFESDYVNIGLMRMVSEFMLSPKTAGSAIALIGYVPICHKFGMSLPEGGSGRLSECLEACFKDFGGEVRLSSTVTKFKVSGGKCTGVVLANGEEITARKGVVTNFNVMQLPAMVGEENLPDDFKKNVKRLKPSDFMTFHMELALNDYPKFRNTLPAAATWFLEVVDHLDMVDFLKTFDNLQYGIPNTKAPLLMCPTVIDPTRAPAGKHTLYVYQFAPMVLRESGAKGWDAIKEKTMDELLVTLENLCTNMDSSNILGKWAFSPYDYAKYNPAWPNGDFCHFNQTVLQASGNRPAPGWSNYKTPVDKLFIVGPSTHPGWSVNGAARAAMWTIFEDLGMDFEPMTK